MRKTILLVFIHGFKGGDDTFGTFPEHLSALISHALPKVDVLAVAYPRFETRGELKDCVARVREWLENKVIDLEVARGTPSPTIDPSVHVVLVGHSMGGIVAAETLILLDSEKPIPPASSISNPDAPNFASNTTMKSTTSSSRPNPELPEHPDLSPASFMFPHIQGVLAFDTPFLGLAPGMVAHSIEGGHKVASSAYGAFNEISSAFGWGSKAEVPAASSASKPLAALPAPSSAADAAAAPKWQSWGKYAMFAGAAGAVAAGGAAALYSQREKISAGWAWAGSHLLFVGSLARPEEMRKRVETLENVCQERGLGCANFYTNLGRGAREGYGITAEVVGKERTFCNLPNKVREGRAIENKTGGKPSSIDNGRGLRWHRAINEKAKDETMAHMSMFFPRDNPGFYTLGEKAKEVILAWVDRGWYETSEGKSHVPDGAASFGEVGDEWVAPDAGDSSSSKHAVKEEGTTKGKSATKMEKDVNDQQLQSGATGTSAGTTTSAAGEGSDWDGLDANKEYDIDDIISDDNDVQMTEVPGDGEELGGSVIVDKASKSESLASLQK